VALVNDRRILITGGSGFIGTNLVEHYLSAGVPVANFDQAPPSSAGHRSVWRQGDILDPVGLRRAVDDFSPTHIVHLAARTDIRGATLSDYPENVAGVTNVIAASQQAPDVRRMVFTSSRLVARIGYQPRSDRDYCPPNAYGESKMVGEQLVREADLPCTWLIVRPTSIWGPWFAVPYKDFFMAVARNYYAHVRGVSVRKSFGFVLNSVHQIDTLLETADENVHGKTMYLADYPPIRVEEMADCIQRELGTRKIRSVPSSLLKPAARAGDALRLLGWTEPPLTTFRLNNLVTEMLYDLEGLERIVGPLPYSMEEGVGITVDWLRRHGEISNTT
jgi:nucleoside-diphosphate-sugar epimerase